MIVWGEESFNRFKNDECMYSCSVFYKMLSCIFDRLDRFYYKILGDDEYYLIYVNCYILLFLINFVVNFILEKWIYDF